MELTDEHLELCFAARLASNTGGGIAVDPDFIPAAHELDKKGWLEHRMVDGHVAWFWTEAGEIALCINGLMQSVQGRHN